MSNHIVYMERAQRRIAVNYARRQQGRKMYAAQSTHLPFKINMSGVIPPIFASSILLFPATIAQFFGQTNDPNMVQGFLQTIGANLGPGQPVYVIFYVKMSFMCSVDFKQIKMKQRYNKKNNTRLSSKNKQH